MNMIVNRNNISKTCLLFWLYFVSISAVQAQNVEKGLVYSPEVMNRLKFIVDSMHIKYKKCEFSKKYLSLPQTVGYAIRSTENIAELKKDLESKMPLKKLREKYPHAISEIPNLIIKHLSQNYKGEKVTHFEVINLKEDSYDIKRDSSWYDRKLKKQAIFDYYDSEDFKMLLGVYIEKDFTIQAIPTEYAHKILYVDCMIDTTARVILTEKEDYYNDELTEKSLLRDFEKLILKASKDFSDKKPFPKDASELVKKYQNNEVMPTAQEFEAILQAQKNIGTEREKWHKESKQYIHSQIQAIPNFQGYIKQLVATVIKENQSSELIENYLQPYLSKIQMLDFKRRRQVIGQCSMDNSPVEHALEIATLSAETAQWNIFLRSHLDVMNDRFQRVSDGSYAWEKRATYFAELEALDIDVLDLLLGISLRASNTSKGHYYGNVSRVGKALSEATKKTVIEDTMLRIIADESLDVYNRVLMYFTFTNYNHHLNDENLQKVNQKRLKEVLQKVKIPIFQGIK